MHGKRHVELDLIDLGPEPPYLYCTDRGGIGKWIALEVGLDDGLSGFP